MSIQLDKLFGIILDFNITFLKFKYVFTQSRSRENDSQETNLGEKERFSEYHRIKKWTLHLQSPAHH